ncbi:2-amino-4-hydroxy-6-hydroxymethyldihydropteridine diphosphokinase [Deinococcus psychrotolerans]|uniref:2-amino-4-hydroxy-6-hydroxymethyldihydropteridine diphosphokinase n=1 Tax=Deinococcus psychrotolerans TaxID=2489213 RepID=A0A3G8Y8S7_9DEIO|nr:2-amino-4-hydroxy-6-hydroxymethyldihydropteridine diphosphokinase [Deinococcus psychrotolerans]AZI41772.1 2-amino-4-hydroxy-6-hydroxymethyldihydropteridine diphosphokinase [Deinococcus psychrotolerans]
MRATTTETALIALGANLGDPEAALKWAVHELAALGEVQAVSAFYRTAPVGGPGGQPDYLNAAAKLCTNLSPEALLDALLDLETRYGRVRRERWAARVLDLDLIAYGQRVLSTPRLTLPHPRAWEREFVLRPLSDLDPDYVHPLTGQSVSQALAELDRARQ